MPKDLCGSFDGTPFPCANKPERLAFERMPGGRGGPEGYEQEIVRKSMAFNQIWMPKAVGPGPVQIGAMPMPREPSNNFCGHAARRVHNRAACHWPGPPCRGHRPCRRLSGHRIYGCHRDGTARHTLCRHGNPATEAERGRLAVTEDDVARAPQLLYEFDSVRPADPTKQGALQVLLLKRIGTVDYEVFAEVRQAGRVQDHAKTTCEEGGAVLGNPHVGAASDSRAQTTHLAPPKSLRRYRPRTTPER